MTIPTATERPAPVSFIEAFRFWLKLGFISFGGPAGQIAIMHTELVERRRWISEKRFLHALNYCMLLPGPEAQQLATYIGWLMHRSWGGIVAGALFVLPSLFILIGLSWIYLAWGNVPVVAGIFYGIKPAVTALVLGGVGLGAFALAREYQAGRIIAVAHEDVLSGSNIGTNGKSDRNKGFLWRALQWLSGPWGNASVVIASGHCEWLPTRKAKWALPDDLAAWGYKVSETAGAIDDASLKDASVLIIGNAWGNFEQPEIDAIQRFVARGGGLLAAGLGWSWRQSGAKPNFVCEGQSSGQDVNDMTTYPMNRVGAAFGLQWSEIAIGG